MATRAEVIVVHYKLHILDRSGRVVRRLAFQARNDMDARAAAQEVRVDRRMELWSPRGRIASWEASLAPPAGGEYRRNPF